MLANRSYLRRFFKVFLTAVLVISLSPSLSTQLAAADETVQDSPAQTKDKKAGDASENEEAKSDAKANANIPAPNTAEAKADAAPTPAPAAAGSGTSIDEKPTVGSGPTEGEKPAANPETDPNTKADADIKADTKTKDKDTAAVSNAKKGNTRDGSGDNVIDGITLVIDAPQEGLHSVAADAIATSEHVNVISASFKSFKGYSTNDPSEINFVAGQTYYACVRLQADAGYVFKKGEPIPNLDIDACDYKFGGTAGAIDGQTGEFWVVDSAAIRSEATPELLYVWLKVKAVSKSDTVYLCTSRSEEGGTLKMQATYENEDMEGSSDAYMSNFALPYGASVTLTATPAQSHRFVGFYEGIRGSSGFVEDYNPSKLLSSEPSLSFAIEENTNIYAVFEAPTHEVSFDMGGHWTPVPDTQQIENGSFATRPERPNSYPNYDKATDGSGLNFQAWYSEPVSTSSTYTDLCYDRARGGKIFDFSKEAITDDTVVYAGWDGVLQLDTYDLSNAKRTQGGKVKGGSVYYTMSNWGASAGVTVMANTEATAQAEPLDGYRFIGWSTSISENDIVSTDATYTFLFTKKTELYALFKESVTVSFNAHGGSPVPADQVIDKNGKAIKPDTDPVKEPFEFRGWFESEYQRTYPAMEPVVFGTKTFSENTTLHAGWSSYFQADVYDASSGTPGFGGYGIPGRVKVGDMSPAYTYTYPRCPEGFSVSIEAQPGSEYRFLGWKKGETSLQPSGDFISSDITYQFTNDGSIKYLYAVFTKQVTVSYDANGGTAGVQWKDDEKVDAGVTNLSDLLGETVPNNVPTSIVGPPADKVFNGYTVTDSEGNKTRLLPGESINYPITDAITVAYEWIPVVTLTLHWSSIDGVDLQDPIKIKVRPGATIKDALATINKGMEDPLFEKDGYQDYGCYTPNPLTNYANDAQLWNAKITETVAIEKDTDFYRPMLVEINKIELGITAPKCNTETTTQKDGNAWKWDTQTNPPDVTVSSDTYDFDYYNGIPWHFWIVDEIDGDAYVGTLTGGNSYLVESWLESSFGYTFAQNPSVTVTGGEVVDSEYDGGYFGVYANVAVTHEPKDPVIENKWDATCAKPDYYEEVVYCSLCGEEISRTPHEGAIDPDAHAWGEWEKSKEPSCVAPGEEKRVCANDSSHVETREYGAIDPDAHDWDAWKTITEPTRTEPGLKRRICKHDASHMEEAEISPLGAVTIVYDPNGGTFRGATTPTALEYTVGDTIKIAEAPTRAGYTFLYWKGSKYKPGDSYTAKDNHTFTAVWEKNTEKVTPAPSKSSKPSKMARTGDTVALWSLIGLLITSAGAVVFARRKVQR